MSKNENDLDKTQTGIHKVIEIPTRMNFRHRALSKARDQKAVAALSLGSVVLIGLFLNQLITRNTSEFAYTQTANRQVASVGQISSPEGIKWEAELAKQLNAEKNLDVIGGTKPRQSDQLLFGDLKGQYAAKFDSNMKIQRLELVGEGTHEVRDFSSFLISKKGLWSRNFDRVSILKDEGNMIEADLYQNSQKVGKVKIERNAFGYLKSVEIQ